MRRSNAYDRDQHRLICDLLDVSDSSSVSGDTAFEAVVRLEEENCRLRERLEALEGALTGCAVVKDERDECV